MANTKTPIQIDGTDYQLEDMTEKQQLLVQHLLDLDRKINNAKFSMDQLQVGRDAFIKILKQDLEETKEATPAE
jgi:hypothetical protein